jgi:uncharacterized protein
MAAQYHTIDLDRLTLQPGQGTRLDLEFEPQGMVLGGNDYEPAPATVPARVDISRTAAGYALRLRFETTLEGPCVRCLGEAAIEVAVDAREVDQPASRDEELLSPYVDAGVVDLSRWAHDALALAVPEKLLCRSDCAGLCPVCGESLNEGPHSHEREPDPRWAKLRELQ